MFMNADIFKLFSDNSQWFLTSYFGSWTPLFALHTDCLPACNQFLLKSDWSMNCDYNWLTRGKESFSSQLLQGLLNFNFSIYFNFCHYISKCFFNINYINKFYPIKLKMEIENTALLLTDVKGPVSL